jgi:single-strand DNA-binding protein
MYSGLNKWLGAGNMVADPELLSFDSGSLLKFRVACNERYFDRVKAESVSRVEYVQVVIFGKRAESLSKLLRKGAPVFVEGSLRNSSWEKDGIKRYKTEVIASNVILLGRAADVVSNPAPAEDFGDYAADDDTPF